MLARQSRREAGSGLDGCSWLDHLLHRGTDTRLLIGSGVAMQHTHLHSLINLAEGGIHGGLNSRLGVFTRGLGISAASGEAALHQGAQGRLVGAVAETVALGNLNALLR